jgi:hypothetical protein
VLDVSNDIECRKRDWRCGWDWRPMTSSTTMDVVVVVGCRRKTGHSRELEWTVVHLLTDVVPSAHLVTRRPCSGRRILEGTAVSASTSRMSTRTGSCCSNSTCANSSCLFRWTIGNKN